MLQADTIVDIYLSLLHSWLIIVFEYFSKQKLFFEWKNEKNK